MDYIANEILGKIDIYLLIFIRITAIFLLMPFFSQQFIPGYMKIGFSALVASLFIAFLPSLAIEYDHSILGFVFVVIKEFLTGMIIGFAGYLFFTTFYLAGQMIDFQMGFSMVSVIDPLSQIQIPITGNIYYLLATIILLEMNGHHKILLAISESFQIVPLGTMKISSNFIQHVIQMGTDLFVIGIKIAIPIMICIFILDVSLGLLSRVAPQLNVYVVGFILKIILGLMAIILILPSFYTIVDVVFNTMLREIIKVMRNLS